MFCVVGIQSSDSSKIKHNYSSIRVSLKQTNGVLQLLDSSRYNDISVYIIDTSDWVIEKFTINELFSYISRNIKIKGINKLVMHSITVREKKVLRYEISCSTPDLISCIKVKSREDYYDSINNKLLEYYGAPFDTVGLKGDNCVYLARNNPLFKVSEDKVVSIGSDKLILDVNILDGLVKSTRNTYPIYRLILDVLKGECIFTGVSFNWGDYCLYINAVYVSIVLQVDKCFIQQMIKNNIAYQGVW